MDLKGKNAIITGASKGIGKAIAVRLAQEGVNLILAARTQVTLDETINEIKKGAHGKVVGVPTDVSKLEDLQHLTNTALKQFGTIDILIDRKSVV